MRPTILENHRAAAAGGSPFSPIARSGGIARWRRLPAAILCGIACAGFAACASAAPYNPDNLGSAQIARVAGICQFVMGLRPSERPVWGTHLGDLHLAIGASHYQGCVTSLSDSLQQAGTADAAAQADQDCRARGFAAHTPGLAVCVLQALDARTSVTVTSASAAQTQTTAAAPNGAPARTVQVGSFFYASPRETSRREQLACAQLGLEPPGALFAHCVQGLRSTFFAIDNPVE
jgi:hypothetical protein